MGQLAIRLHVGDTVYVGARDHGEAELSWKARTGWTLTRIVAPNATMELQAPSGQTVRIFESRGVEIMPDVIVFVGVTPANEMAGATVARVVFRAPREIPILRAGAQRVR